MGQIKVDEWKKGDGLLLIEGWARAGLKDEEIAANIGIQRQTLYTWKKKYKDIDDALKKGRAPLHIIVENALLKRALGYDYEEITQERMLDRKTGEYKMVETKRLKKHMPSDITAIIFWLKNRRSSEWNDRKQDIRDIMTEAQESGLIEIQKIEEIDENGGETDTGKRS